jgi:DNA-binding PadR family transcriptional regulator
MKSSADRFLPLSPATLHILLALAGQDRHGYGIMQEVARQSDGSYKLGPGTLYDNLQRLVEQELVEERESKHSEDSRRRYYRLTSSGTRILAAEITRLEGVIREARLFIKQPLPTRTQ